MAEQAGDVLGRVDRPGGRQGEHGNPGGEQGASAGRGVVGLLLEYGRARSNAATGHPRRGAAGRWSAPRQVRELLVIKISPSPRRRGRAAASARV